MAMYAEVSLVGVVCQIATLLLSFRILFSPSAVFFT